MTTRAVVSTHGQESEFVTTEAQQQTITLQWCSRGEWYDVCQLTITHNPGYPTPALVVVAPPPGIGLDVYSHKGDPLWTTKPRPTFDNGSPT